jgi:hypothetical protein
LRSRQLCSYSRTSQHFMEPEGSLPCSEQPSTGPYPEPDQLSPYHPIIILSTPYVLAFPVVSFLLAFWPPVPFGQETGWAAEPVWTLWSRDKSNPCRESNLGRPARSCTTEISRLVKEHNVGIRGPCLGSGC